MGGFGSLSIATSGMSAAQLGISVTGHNLANANTVGYTRQQAMQTDWSYLSIGAGKQVGLGTNVNDIRQIRDKYIDIQYRNENSKLTYYNTKANAGLEVQNLLGELNADYSTKTAIQNMWNSINELSMNPESIDSRGVFISTAVELIDNMTTVYDGLRDYQNTLNQQVKDTVGRINELTATVGEMNERITAAEVTGDSANDYRDIRNNALDELSALTGCTIKEKSNGQYDLFIDGQPLLVNNLQSEIGLRYTGTDTSFVEPVFTSADGVLPADDTSAKSVFDIYNISPGKGNDKSTLRALLVTRGSGPANYASSPQMPDATDTAKYPLGSKDPVYRQDYEQYQKDLFNTQEAVIPSTMKKLDTVFNSIVSLINDTLAPQEQMAFDDPNNTHPMGLDGTQYMEIFVRKDMDRYGADTDGNGLPDYNAENPDDYHSLYTLGNVEINPELLDVAGYDKIPLSPGLGGAGIGTGNNTADVSNNSVIIQLMEDWKNPIVQFTGGTDPNGNQLYEGEAMSIDDSYNHFIGGVAVETRESQSYVDQQIVVMTQLSNNRQAMSGVSMDEELNNMMKYQHAYNASVRVVNAIDSMIDQVVNKM